VEKEKEKIIESDEEDDDDSGDLSKYNLFDDDDIDIEALRAKK
jgi:hypothetical protein